MRPVLQVPLQAVVLGEERCSKLENGLGPGLAPELLRAVDSLVEELDGGLDVAARSRQSLLAIARGVHSLLVALQGAEFLVEHRARIVVGQIFDFVFR